MWLRCRTSCAVSGASSHSWLVLLLDRRRRPHWRRHRPGTPPRALLSAAQRRCIHCHAERNKALDRRGCCSMGGELECTEGELRDERRHTNDAGSNNGAQFLRHYTAAATRNRSTWAAAACPHHSLSHSVGTQSLAHSTHQGFGRTFKS